MRRTVIGVLLSVVTFAVGYGIANLGLQSSTIVPAPQVSECLPQVPAAPETEPPKLEQSKTPDFVPEIMNLADFADLGLQDFKLKLVDIHEHENAYRKSEVIAKNKEQWLGLFEKDEKFYLKTTQVSAKFDPKYEGYGDEDYVRLTTSDNGNPVFILKNVGTLKPGPVESLYLRPTYDEIQRRRLYDKPVKIGYEEYFTLGGNEYVIRVNRGLTKENDKVLALMLSVNGISQAITYMPYYGDDDIVGHPVWVGDLDRDNKLDMYLDHDGYESCGFSSSLFLSSAAKKGELVRQVAAFGTAGC